MRKLILCAALATVIGGCSTAELLFSESARQELVDNFEGGVESQQLVPPDDVGELSHSEKR